MRVCLRIWGILLILTLCIYGCEQDRVVASIDDSDPVASLDGDVDGDTDSDSDSDVDTETETEGVSCQDTADNRDYNINTNSGLDDISEFSIIRGDLNIISSTVTALHKLKCLKYVTGNLRIQGTALQDLEGLSELVRVGGTFSILDNYNLQSLEGLEKLNHIGGLIMVNNTELTSIEQLGTVNDFGSMVTIDHNYTLSSLEGLENLVEVGHLTISYNNYLQTLCGLENLTRVYGDFLLGYNFNLLNLSHLLSLESVYGDFKIYDNYSIINLIGLESFTEVNDLSICGNISLETMQGLEFTDVQGNLKIGCANYLHYDPANGITDMTGLETLKYVNGFFLIMINDYMTDLSGLENLVSIGDYLHIWYNLELQSLDGLNGLRAIGGYLRLEQNSLLNNLYALCDLEMMGDLYYECNDSLDECEAYALVERLYNIHGWCGAYHTSPEGYMEGDLSYCEEWMCSS